MHTYNNDTFINTAQITGHTAITLAYCILQKQCTAPVTQWPSVVYAVQKISQ